MTQKHRLTFQIIRLIVGFPLIVLSCIVWGFQEWWFERKEIKSALFLLTTCLPVFAQDLYVNFEGVSAGTSASASIMGTISKTNGNAVAFSYVGTSTGISVENQTTFPGLLTPITVAGTPYTNSSPTKALYVRPDVGGDGNLQKLLWTYAASRKVSCGFSITMTNFGSAATDFYNCGGFETGGDYGVISMVADAGVPYIQAETVGGTGADILIGGNGNNALTIWVTTLWDSANDKYVCAFYNQTNMALMGFSTMPTTHNATVNTMGWGGTGSHTFAAGENYWLNNLILYTNGTVWPVWPGGNLQCLTNATDTAFNAAQTLASAGDRVVLPITNISWSSGVNLTKKLFVYGMDTTSRSNTVLNVGNSATAFTLTADYGSISNLHVKGTKPAAAGNYNNIGFEVFGQSNIIANCMISQMQIGLYSHQWGLSFSNFWVDNTKFRHIWDNGTMSEPVIFSTFYPLPYNSLIHWVYENDVFHISDQCNTNGALGYFSSQQSPAYTVRYSTIIWSNANCVWAPMFDFHGDDVGGSLPRPGMSVEVYNVDIYALAYQNSAQKFADIRATQSDIHSNRLFQIANATTDHELAYREERPSDVPNYVVTNSYVCENYRGATATTPMTITQDATVTSAGGLTVGCIPPALMMVYPHPMRGVAGQQTIVPPFRVNGTMIFSGKGLVQ